MTGTQTVSKASVSIGWEVINGEIVTDNNLEGWKGVYQNVTRIGQ